MEKVMVDSLVDWWVVRKVHWLVVRTVGLRVGLKVAERAAVLAEMMVVQTVENLAVR